MTAKRGIDAYVARAQHVSFNTKLKWLRHNASRKKKSKTSQNWQKSVILGTAMNNISRNCILLNKTFFLKMRTNQRDEAFTARKSQITVTRYCRIFIYNLEQNVLQQSYFGPYLRKLIDFVIKNRISHIPRALECRCQNCCVEITKHVYSRPRFRVLQVRGEIIPTKKIEFVMICVRRWAFLVSRVLSWFWNPWRKLVHIYTCLLYTSDAADE